MIIDWCRRLRDPYCRFCAAVADRCQRAADIMPHLISTFTLLSLAVGIGTLIYWSLFDTRPKVWSTRVATYSVSDRLTTVFHPGEIVYIERDFCASETLPALVSRRWIKSDGRIMFLGQSGEQIIEAGCETARNPISLPAIMPPGQYVYHTSASYDQNPLRRATVLFPLAEITVVNDGR